MARVEIYKFSTSIFQCPLPKEAREHICDMQWSKQPVKFIFSYTAVSWISEEIVSFESRADDAGEKSQKIRY